jgi:hypothetical protein
VLTPEQIAAAEAAQQRLAATLTASMDLLNRAITETPEERKQRLHDEQQAADKARREADDAIRASLGETPEQRAERHHAEDRARRERERIEDREKRHKTQRAATRLWKASPDQRARRFRRWCTLTALSASIGYSIGIVQWVGGLPALVAGFALIPTYAFDLYTRNCSRLSALDGWLPVTAVIFTRVPVASVLASLLHLNQLLAASGHLFHHH